MDYRNLMVATPQAIEFGSDRCHSQRMNAHETSMQDGWNRLAAAVESALRVHAQQMRKGTDTPYVSHLLGVASLVLEYGGDEEQAMAAILHDAIEDQGTRLGPVIRQRCGARMVDI